MKRPRILYIAYPLLTVSDESCGGAEQMLGAIEAEMAARGYETVVAASQGSQVAGALLNTGEPCSEPDDLQRREAEHVAVISDFLHRHDVDLIHDHSGSFWRHVPGGNAHSPVAETPVLSTLHLPRGFYPADAFISPPPNVTFNCVSSSQQREFSDLAQFVVFNGIAVNRFPRRDRKEEYLLWMGRICEEKAPHLAIEVARRCGMRLVLAGEVYPFSWHQRYFEREILPALQPRDSLIHYVGPQRVADKLRLLRRARALLLTSQCAETSSLAAMEAMACGTPVIAFCRGAIPEIVLHQRTGFIVDSVEEMANAVRRAECISPQACREHAENHFSAARMADGYERLYAVILQHQTQTTAA